MSRPTDTELFVSIGRVRGAHGIRGELSCEISQDQWDLLHSVKTVVIGPPVASGVGTPNRADETSDVVEVRGRSERAILQVSHVNDRERAASYRGYSIFLSRDQMPSDRPGSDLQLGDRSLIRADLIGLAVEDRSGNRVGRVFDVIPYPAHSVLAVSDQQDADINNCTLLPFVSEVILRVDLAAGVIVADERSAVDNG